MSILAKKLEEEIKQKKTGFLLVSETLEFMSKATDSPIDDVKEYLLFNGIDVDTPVYHYQGGSRFEVLETSRPDGYFTGTRKALKEPLEGNEYFLIDDLKQFEPLSEYDIFAYQRGYYYIAKQAIGQYNTGDKIPTITDDDLKDAVRRGRTVKGLTKDRAEFLLSKGAIEKLYIKDIEAKQSRQVQSLTKQVEYLQAQLNTERKVNTSSSLEKENQVSEKTIEELVKENEQLATDLDNAKDKIAELEKAIEEVSSINPSSQSSDFYLYDWEAMNKNQYPPELHLVIEVWKEYYQADNLENFTQFNSGRFNRIATELNLDEGKLKERIRTIITPLESKTRAPSLMELLVNIDILHTNKLREE